MQVMEIVFLGATGMIGNVVATHLANSGRDVTAIVRDPARGKAKLPASVKLVKGDVAEPSTLTPVRDADVVIFMLSIDTKRAKPGRFNADLDGIKAVLQAAPIDAMPHIVYLSSLLEQGTPHPWWVMSANREATSSVAMRAPRHTILRPSNLMENLPSRFVRGKSVSYIGKPREKGWWIAAEDIGRMLNSHLNRSLEKSYDIPLQGPEPMTAKEAVERYAAVKGLKPSRAPTGVMALIGTFVPELSYAVKISKAMNDAPEPFQSEQVWKDLGKPQLSIEDFARRAI